MAKKNRGTEQELKYSQNDDHKIGALSVIIITAAIAGILVLGGMQIVGSINSRHLPSLPDVAVASTSAASVVRLSDTSAAAAADVKIGILVRNKNSKPLSFSHVSLEVQSSAVSPAPPFDGERKSSYVAWFRLGNLTVPVVGPGESPRLETVKFRARVRFGGHAWPSSSNEISMSASCPPAFITFDLKNNNNNNNISSVNDAVSEEEIFNSGGCNSKGLWDRNTVWLILLIFIYSLMVLPLLPILRNYVHNA